MNCALIPKQLEELVFGCVGFTPEFPFSLAPCPRAMAPTPSDEAVGGDPGWVARSEQKFWGSSLPDSQLFKLFGYT